uniref:Uncharacterized protein n=1 Tax=Ditylenchus dipsaci TaxID=166011 RepID=A0A915DSE9_9BILA
MADPLILLQEYAQGRREITELTYNGVLYYGFGDVAYPMMPKLHCESITDLKNTTLLNQSFPYGKLSPPNILPTSKKSVEGALSQLRECKEKMS